MGDEESLYKVTYLDVEEDSEEVKEFTWIARAGKASVIYDNGAGVVTGTYVGDFNDEKMKHGTGTYTWMAAGEEDEEPKQTAKYEGAYVNGKKNGVGKMEFPNQDSYHGEWKDNKMHGEGLYKYAKTGDIYSGTWVEGQKSGEGCYEFGADLSKLQGTWEGGKFTTGEWIYKGAGSYKGNFENGQPTGAGSFTFVNGITQEGEYVTKQVDEENPEAVEITWVGKPVYSSV